MATESFEEMMKGWMDTQKKMWDSYFETMQGYTKPPAAQSWDQMVALGEETMKKTTQAQAEWIEMWVKSVASVPGTPAQVTESAKQMQTMYLHWSETQEKLWANWFSLLKSFDPTKGMSAWATMPTNPMQMWQDTSRRMMDAQFEWMRVWMGQRK